VLDKNNTMSKIENIIVIIRDLINKKFTGEFEIKIVFSQGGIRRIQKTVKEDL
jgi:hypothetical protein